MHRTAIQNCKEFFDTYAVCFEPQTGTRVVEIGSLDVNGSLRSVTPAQFEYTGVDFAAGKGVDVLLTDPYQIPLPNECADIVLSSSCFEHSEMFWISFLEVMRILKPRGLFYLNAPSNGNVHRYPVDCWRFYPDSGRALVAWAQRNGIDAVLLESFISSQNGGLWNDFVAVIGKDLNHSEHFSARILDNKRDFTNGLIKGHDGFLKPTELPEDKRRLRATPRVIQRLFEFFRGTGKV